MNSTPSAGLFLALLALSLFSCQDGEIDSVSGPLFTSIPPDYSGIDFYNRVDYDEELNCYTFRNFYNGGGVGIGDFNNDGLPDVFFCGNMVSNRLYLNKGNFKFEDITQQSGTGSKGVWSSGVAVADVNGDGWLDIYVCKSGPPGGAKRHNELFINNAREGQTPSFTEKSREMGLNDEGLSVHATFFDFDQDGDLDFYLLNNSLRSVGGYDLIKNQRNVPDPQGGNKLYRQDRQLDGSIRFTDVSAQAGIYRSNIGFGLGVAAGDLNRDGAQDLFVSNDFFEKDYLYINQTGEGPAEASAAPYFAEHLEDCIRETSMGSMGADIADLNNDGLPEIFVTEMLPQDDRRIKTKTKFEHWDLYRQEVENGYYHQFTRNTLQLNLGPAPRLDGAKGKDLPLFAEISRLAGVHATDWSWGALILDMDNDGWKDIFVANGIGKDLTDQDYVNFYSDPANVRDILKKQGNAISRMVDDMPAEKIPNYAFRNNLADVKPDSLSGWRVPTFTDMAAEWGLAQPSFSNGSAYADFDNDGDLDLVVNNQDMPTFLYRNNAESRPGQHNFLSLRLKGEGLNTQAVGARALLYLQGEIRYQEVAPMRGFESTVDHRLHFGLGRLEKADSLVVRWPDGRTTTLADVQANQFLVLEQQKAAAKAASQSPKHASPLFTAHPASTDLYRHRENDFDDFDRDRLIFQMLSVSGPPLCKGDVNGDGREDVFIGGAKDQAGSLLLQQADGSFKASGQALFEQDKISEDTDCLFFDADGDRDLDLYVASGGNEFPNSSSALLDRLYLNDGRGQFAKSPSAPLSKFESTGVVEAADFDGDGDKDLFVGVRLRPFLYGVPCNGYLLQNDGKGHFTDVTGSLAPGLRELGMITSAVWADTDRDGDADLAVAGEWMPVVLFDNQEGRLVRKAAGEALPSGWWNCLTAADLNGDGFTDLIAGNHGLNSRFRVASGKPATMWVNDFDQNQSAEQIISIYNGEASYPLALRNDLVAQLPYLKKKYLYFRDYAEQRVEDIFLPEQLQGALRLEAGAMETLAFINDGKGGFKVQNLPLEAQMTPVYAILAEDLDEDGHIDLLMGGNFYHAKPETGIYDGSLGCLLLGDGKGGFRAESPEASGINLRGAIRNIQLVKNKWGPLLFFGKNDAELEVLTLNKQNKNKER
jgi:hypothetical protein